MKHAFAAGLSIVLFTGIASLVGCDVDDVSPSGITAQYQLENTEQINNPETLRYEVIWMGLGVYEVTNQGPIQNPSMPFSVHFDLPSTGTLQNVRPIDTLTYNFHYLPEPEVRRPRVVVYEDLNGNDVFNLETDRIVALDGVGYDRYTAVIALENLDLFLSQLTFLEQTIYYGWTRDEYTAFLYAGASQYWSANVYPLFENAYIDAAVSKESVPTMTLLTEPQVLMEKDLSCYRQVARTTTITPKEMWVDSTLDVETVCSKADVPCYTFDASTATPDIDSMAEFADDFYTLCGWTEDGVEIIEARQGVISCHDCDCTVDFFTTYFAFHRDNIPLSPMCTEDTPLPSAIEFDASPLDENN